MKTCAASSCNNNSVHNSDLSWHVLPRERWMREQWIDLLGVSELEINSTTRICSAHFKTKDFHHNKNFLKPDVVPSVRLADSANLFKEEEDTDMDASEDDDDDDDDYSYGRRSKRTKVTKRVVYSPAAAKEETPPEPTARPSRRAALAAAEKILHTVRKYGGASVKKEVEIVQIHVDLVMECYDDVLTSSQLIAHSKAQKLFDETNRRIRQLRFENAKFLYSVTPEEESAFTAPQPEPIQTLSTFKRNPIVPGGRTPRSMLFTKKANIDPSTALPSSSLAYQVVLAPTSAIVSTPLDVTSTTKLPDPPLTTTTTTEDIVQIDEVTVEESSTTDGIGATVPSADVPFIKVFIKGGMKAVTAKSLMSIHLNVLITPEANLTEQAEQLEGILEKEMILENPIKWFVKLHLVAERPACRFCVPAHCNTGLETDDAALDGFVWRCYGCTKSTPVTRLTFFGRFTLSLPKLLKLIFFWVVQADTDIVVPEVDGDVYLTRTVFRALQDVCSRSLANKSNKIGGRGLVVEVAIAQLGNFFVIGAYDRRTKVTRLKAITTTNGENFSNVVQKQLDAWLHAHTVVISDDTKMNGRSRTGLRFQQARVNGNELENVTDYLQTYLTSMFGELMLNQLKLETIQGFLDELQWRARFGKTAWSCFFNMIKDIGQQSGKKVEMSMYEVDLSRMISASKAMATFSRGNATSMMNLAASRMATTFPKVLSSVAKPAESLLKTAVPSPPPPPPKAVSSPVSSTSLDDEQAKRARKRALEECVGTEKKKIKVEDEEGSEGEVAVILDEYYYARKDPIPVFAEEKGNFQFKCLVCTKVVDNNIKVMKHLMAHIENSRQKNLDLSDLTQCKYCFRDFDTPYSMQCHIESVHLNTNELACQICNQAFPNTASLVDHMKLVHVQSDMPYSCQVCCYRSSFHREVVEHFQQEHNSSDRLLCHYCLKVFQIKFSVAGGFGLIQSFYYHLYKHQMKSTAKKCNACCLVFFNNIDWKSHKAKDHNGFHNLEGVTPMECQSSKLVLVKDPQKKPENKPKIKSSPTAPSPSPNPSTSKGRRSSKSECSSVLVPEEYNEMHCIECKKPIEKEHFEKYVSCSKCHYSTNCCEAFVEHMICEHSKLIKKRFVQFKPSEAQLPQSMFCICGFSTSNGDNLANHLVQCGKKSCYASWNQAMASTVKTEPDDDFLENGSAFFAPLVVLEEDEEKVLNERFSKSNSGDATIEPPQDEPPPPSDIPVEKTEEEKEKPPEKVGESHPCMLNALGLVRRRSSSTKDESDSSREAPPTLSREDGDGDSNKKSRRRKQRATVKRKQEDEIKKEIEEEEVPPELEDETK